MTTINYQKSVKNSRLMYLPRWPPVNIEFQDLSYSVPDGSGKKVILREVSGQFQSGQVTAVLGASGAGKSTLLNILAGFKISHTSDGNVLINGKPRCTKTFRKMSRYIMQKDLHQSHITVHEAMTVSADLKIGNDLTKSQKNDVIEEILDLLRLTKTSRTMCHQLSGGEKKRLSIALELVDNPPVIFLDEPTTGLDDLSSSQCISLLRRIALGGRTVICSIHTPSAKMFTMFDHVYAMAGGQCVYQGNPSQILSYMQTIGLTCPRTYNPADFIVEVSCGEHGIEYIDRMIGAMENGKCCKWSLLPAEKGVSDESGKNKFLELVNIDPKQLEYRSSSWNQFKVLYIRRWKQTWRDSFGLPFKMCVTFFLAVLLGFLYRGCGNDASKAMFNVKYQFTCTILFTYASIMIILVYFPSEIPLLKREHFNRWFKLAPYYCALVLGTGFTQIVLCSIFIAVTYPMSNQPLEWMRICMFCSITIMSALVSERLGLIVASRFSLTNGTFIGPASVFPLMVLAVHGVDNGSFAELSLFLKFLRNCSYLRFTLEGLFDATYGYDRADTICPDTEMFCLFTKAGYVKHFLGFHESSYLVSMVALWSNLLLFTTISYYLIKMRIS